MINKKIKYKVALPIVAVSILGSSLLPTNSDAMKLLNSLGSNVLICEAKSMTPEEAKEVCKEEGWSMPTKGGNNEEKTLGYGRDGKIYKSVKGYTNYPKLRSGLEDKFSEDELYNGSIWTTIGRTYYQLRDYLNDKEERAELAQLAADTIKGVKSTDKEAALVALATYYGIINDEDNLFSYDRAIDVNLPILLFGRDHRGIKQ